MVRRYHALYSGWLAAFFAVVTLIVSSCDVSSLDTFDIFPPYLERAEASIDLEGILSGEGFGPNMMITRLEQVTSPDGKSLVLLFVEEGDLKRLLVLNAKDLSLVRKEQDTSFNAFLGGDVQGRFLCGAATFTTGTSAVSTDLVLKAALNQYDRQEFLASIGSGDFNALLGVSGASIRLMDFTTTQSWATSTTYTAVISNDAQYNFLDIVRGDGTSDVIRLLFNREGRLVIAAFNDFAALRTAINTASGPGSDFISEASITAGPFYDGSRAWITRDGVVVADGSKQQLSYSSFSDLKSEITLDIGRKYEKSFISVDAKGDRWFLYDSESKWLYALRTWW